MSAANAKRMRGLAIHRSILIGNTATPLSEVERMTSPPDHTHRWTVAVRSAASHPLPTISEAEQLGIASAGQSDEPTEVAVTSGGAVGSSAAAAAGSTTPGGGMSTRAKEQETDYHKMVGGKDDISHFIKRVQFKLHETYPQSTRNIDKPPFQVTETGWGEFDVQVRIFFVAESGEKPISTFHRLKLHPWHPITVPAPDPGVSLPEGGLAEIVTGEPEAGVPTDPEHISTSADVTMANEDQPSTVKAEEASTPVVHETRSASTAAMPAPAPRPLPAVVHSWSYDEIVFPEPTEAFYEVLINNPPTPLPAQSAQAFADPAAYQRYKESLSHLDPSSGPQGRDIHAEAGVLPPHPLHDASGALFDALSQEAILAEGERLDKARYNAVHELAETRSKLIEGERRLRQGRPRLAAS